MNRLVRRLAEKLLPNSTFVSEEDDKLSVELEFNNYYYDCEIKIEARNIQLYENFSDLFITYTVQIQPSEETHEKWQEHAENIASDILIYAFNGVAHKKTIISNNPYIVEARHLHIVERIMETINVSDFIVNDNIVKIKGIFSDITGEIPMLIKLWNKCKEGVVYVPPAIHYINQSENGPKFIVKRNLFPYEETIVKNIIYRFLAKSKIDYIAKKELKEPEKEKYLGVSFYVVQVL